MFTEKKRIAVSKNPAVPLVGREFFYTSFTIKRGNFSIFASLKLSIAIQCCGGIRRGDRLRDCNLCFFYDFPEAFPVGLVDPSLAFVR